MIVAVIQHGRNWTDKNIDNDHKQGRCYQQADQSCAVNFFIVFFFLGKSEKSCFHAICQNHKQQNHPGI